MGNRIYVDVEAVDDKIAIINLGGDVTNLAEKALKEAYQEIAARNVSSIIFNFRENHYINGLGITALIRIVAIAYRNNQQLCVSMPSAHGQKIFRLVGLNEYTHIFTTLDEALTDARNLTPLQQSKI